MKNDAKLKVGDYLEMSLEDFTSEVIDGMKFGDLSRVLEKHLDTSLSGTWGGSRVFEIQQGLSLQGIQMDILSAVTAMGTGTQILLHFYHRPRAELVLRCFTQTNLQSQRGRSEFGQCVGKMALAILAHRAMLTSKKLADPLGPLDFEWTYNKP